MAKIMMIGIGGAGKNIARFIEQKQNGIEEFVLLSEKESDDELKTLLKSAEYVFLVAGLGGEYGTKTMLKLAKLATALNIKAFMTVCMPFGFEGEKRNSAAAAALDKLQEQYHNLTVIPNRKGLSEKTDETLDDIFTAVNQIIYKAVINDIEYINHKNQKGNRYEQY